MDADDAFGQFIQELEKEPFIVQHNCLKAMVALNPRLLIDTNHIGQWVVRHMTDFKRLDTFGVCSKCGRGP